MHRVETRLKGDVWAHERMIGEGYISWIVARAWIGDVVNKYVQFDNSKRRGVISERQAERGVCVYDRDRGLGLGATSRARGNTTQQL